jgi:hypothetical protein
MTKGYKHIIELLKDKDPEENYIFTHHNYSAGFRSLEICLNGGDYDDIHQSSFDALRMRNLLEVIGVHNTIQPDTKTVRYKIKQFL